MESVDRAAGPSRKKDHIRSSGDRDRGAPGSSQDYGVPVSSWDRKVPGSSRDQAMPSSILEKTASSNERSTGVPFGGNWSQGASAGKQSRE